jgi:hypothetical protein
VRKGLGLDGSILRDSGKNTKRSAICTKHYVRPIAYAITLAKHFEAALELEILQANVVSHTAADAEMRILMDHAREDGKDHRNCRRRWRRHC